MRENGGNANLDRREIMAHLMQNSRMLYSDKTQRQILAHHLNKTDDDLIIRSTGLVVTSESSLYLDALQSALALVPSVEMRFTKQLKISFPLTRLSEANHPRVGVGYSPTLTNRIVYAAGRIMYMQ